MACASFLGLASPVAKCLPMHSGEKSDSPRKQFSLYGFTDREFSQVLMGQIRAVTHGGSGCPGIDFKAIFKQLDQNNDGRLTSDAIPASQRNTLLRLDTIQDGAITLVGTKRLRR